MIIYNAHTQAEYTGTLPSHTYLKIKQHFPESLQAAATTEFITIPTPLIPPQYRNLTGRQRPPRINCNKAANFIHEAFRLADSFNAHIKTMQIISKNNDFMIHLDTSSH